jgi:hypothetical protein
MSSIQSAKKITIAVRNIQQKTSRQIRVSLDILTPCKFGVSILKCELAGELLFMRVSFLRIVLYAGLQGVLNVILWL